MMNEDGDVPTYIRAYVLCAWMCVHTIPFAILLWHQEQLIYELLLVYLR